MNCYRGSVIADVAAACGLQPPALAAPAVNA
jgi:hypothetical protein